MGQDWEGLGATWDSQWILWWDRCRWLPNPAGPFSGSCPAVQSVWGFPGNSPLLSAGSGWETALMLLRQSPGPAGGRIWDVRSCRAADGT